MSLLEPPRPALDPALETQRVELADLIYRHACEDGTFTTPVEALFVSRYSQPSDFAQAIQNRRCASWPRVEKRCGWQMSTSPTTR